MTSNPRWPFPSFSLSASVCPSLVQPFSLTPDPVFSKFVWSSDSPLPVLSKRRTLCNLLLISSSLPLQKRVLLPADWGTEELEEGRIQRRSKGEGQEGGLWLAPIRLPFLPCLYLLFSIPCSFASIFLSLSCLLNLETFLYLWFKVQRKGIRDEKQKRNDIKKNSCGSLTRVQESVKSWKNKAST